MSDQQHEPTRSERACEARRDDGMSLVELLVAAAILGLIVTVIAASVVVTMRHAPVASDRVTVARWEQNLGTWLPGDLASATWPTDTPEYPDSPDDPAEAVNRPFYRFNRSLRRSVIGPLARLYNSPEFAPVRVTKNGSPVGNLTGVEIDENGFVIASYSSGFTRVIYQVPIADVPNPNGLTALDNQAFAISASSGPLYLWDAGDGPTGPTLGYALEESTTDIAAELTQLIQTQRAYSSNAKIIQTVDEMLQETTNIKR